MPLLQLDGDFEEAVGGNEGGVGEVGGTRPALRIERRLAEKRVGAVVCFAAF